MPKAKTAKTQKPTKPKAGLLKAAAARLAKVAEKVAASKKKPAEAKPAPAPKSKVAKPVAKAAKPAKTLKAKGAAPKPSPAQKQQPAPSQPLSPFDVKPDKPFPRATKLPPPGQPLTKREMEQLLTAGQGRGVAGEGSLKGRLVVKDGFPYLLVVGRDKRELTFLLQGPDQEVLPAYLDHKVSVSGLLRKATNYGGVVDVRKYSAKKPEAEVPEATGPAEQKLRFLSPGDVEQLLNPGMGAGVKGFATIRGNLEMTGDEYFLVVSNAGTRQQVSFTLMGKGAKALRKHVGSALSVTGVVDKTSGWGGSVDVELVEARPTEFKAVSRDSLEVTSVEGAGEAATAEAKLNGGLSVRLTERAGYTWAIEPTVAKRIGLREANYEPPGDGPAKREFFFTPRNPGTFDIDFYLAKVLSPAQVAKTFKLTLNVKP